MNENLTGDMPSLTLSEKVIEQRRSIKFWVEHCKTLEEKNKKLKEKIRSFYG